MWEREKMQIYAYGGEDWETNRIGIETRKDLGLSTEGALSKNI